MIANNVSAVKAHDLGCMYTIWVVQGQIWLVVDNCYVPQMKVATSPGKRIDVKKPLRWLTPYARWSKSEGRGFKSQCW